MSDKTITGIVTWLKNWFYDESEVDNLLNSKQNTLVSGTNIKTINNNSLLGSGNISISGSGTVDTALDTTSTNPVQNQAIATEINSLNGSITNYCTDTGWVTLTLASGFATYDSTTNPKVRKIGKTVQIRGAVRNTTTITIDTDNKLIFTLPEQYRPSQNLVFTCQGSQMAIFTLTINTGGSVTVSRYRFTNSTSSTYPSLPAGQWMPFSATYFVE